MPRKPPPVPKRPMPPASLLDNVMCTLKPAPEIGAWVRENLLAEDGPIHNPAHQHLIDADIKYLWASSGVSKQQRLVIGQAEKVSFQSGGFRRAREEQQLVEWFGYIPDFLITLDASYCATASDVDWCALVEHEHFHIAHLQNGFGQPAFTKDGLPKLGIKGHDVEEFVGVVERYGAGSADSAVNRMARAAMARPLVSEASISAACGTCGARLRLVA